MDLRKWSCRYAIDIGTPHAYAGDAGPAGCGDGKSRRSCACGLHFFFSCAYVSGAAFVYPYHHGGHGILSICGILIRGSQTCEACLGRTLPRLMLSQPQPYELAYHAHLPHRTINIFHHTLLLYIPGFIPYQISLYTCTYLGIYN